MDRYRDRSVMDRNRDTQRRDENRPYTGGRDEERSWGEGFDREGYTREGRENWQGRDSWQSRDRWQSRGQEWERDRYGRGGGYGQGSAGGYNEQHASDSRSDYAGEDRWRPSRESRPGRDEWGREDRAGGWTASQYDRGGWGSGNASQPWGGGARSSGAGYEDDFDRGRGREFGRGSTGEVRDEWNRGAQQPSGTYAGYGAYGSYGGERYGREPQSRIDRNWEYERNRERDRDWNEDTRDQREGPGIMESIGRFFGFGPKNYRRSDERVTEEINDRLYRHPDIDASDVDVTVKDGEVTLSGTVDSRRAKYLAEDLCDQVMGVKEVNNQLRVRKHAGTYNRGMGMGGSTLGTPSTSPLTEGTGTTGTLGQSQTGTTRDVGDTPRSRNK